MYCFLWLKKETPAYRRGLLLRCRGAFLWQNRPATFPPHFGGGFYSDTWRYMKLSYPLVPCPMGLYGTTWSFGRLYEIGKVLRFLISFFSLPPDFSRVCGLLEMAFTPFLHHLTYRSARISLTFLTMTMSPYTSSPPTQPAASEPKRITRAEESRKARGLGPTPTGALPRETV